MPTLGRSYLVAGRHRHGDAARGTGPLSRRLRAPGADRLPSGLQRRAADRDIRSADPVQAHGRRVRRELTLVTRRRPRLLLAAAALLCAVLVLAVVAALRLVYAGEALPGTRVAGISVSGADAAEIRERLLPLMRSDAPLIVRAGPQRLSVRPSDAGYRIDGAATAVGALRAGRAGALGGAAATFAGLVAGHDVAPVARLDGERLERVVTHVASRVDRPSSAGALDVSPDTLRVALEPPRAGRAIDRGALSERVRDALLRGAPRMIDVLVRRRPVVSLERVRRIAADAHAYVQQPLSLTGAGRPLTVSPRRIAGLLTLEPLDGGRDARLGVDEGEVEALVERLAARRDRPARNAQLTAPARPVSVDGKDDVAWRPQSIDVGVRPARRGRQVERLEAAETIARAIRAGEHAAELPVRRVEPDVSTSDARGVDQLVGTFTTHYQPRQPRVTNIRRIAEAIDGTVVAPDAQFSLNGVAGERTTEKGYVPAPFIADGRIVPSVGGGVSQFSTTAYNAAYFAGLRIDGQRPHSLFIDRYPAGREATLNYPDIDLTWTNDTDVPVLIRTAADATSVSVSLYGHTGGRRVRAETGARQPIEGGDFAITVTRVIQYPDGRTTRDPFTTRYDLPAEGG